MSFVSGSPAELAESGEVGDAELLSCTIWASLERYRVVEFALRPRWP